MFEQLAGDDDVEGAVLERQRVVEIRPTGLDPELFGLGESLAVGVDADDLVPAGVGLRQCPVAATEIEDVAARPTDIATEELDALGACKDEAGAPFDAVVLGVPLAQLLQAHRSSLALTGAGTPRKYTPAGEHEASRAGRAPAGAGRRHPLGAALPPLTHHDPRRRATTHERGGSRDPRPRGPRP